jgi:hypothetical protein
MKYFIVRESAGSCLDVMVSVGWCWTVPVLLDSDSDM